MASTRSNTRTNSGRNATATATSASAGNSATATARGGTATATATASTFALRPSIKGKLDFSRKADLKCFEQGSKSVYDEYPMDAPAKESFLLALSLRAQDQEWMTPNKTGVLDINIGGAKYPLCEHYGSLTLRQVTLHVESWFSAQGRESQDDQMIVECLRASLSSEALLKVYQKREKFHVQDTSLGSTRASGVLMLKVVLDESSLTSNATVMKLKKELTVLPELMESLKFDIPKFNDAVLSVQKQLLQYGSDAPELFHQILPAYLSVPESKFKVYMEAKKSGHEDGSLTLDTASLMELARSRYCTQKDQDDWSPTGTGAAGSPEFMALEAKTKKATSEIKALQKKIAALQKGKGKETEKVKPTKVKKDPKFKKKTSWKFQAPRPGDEVNGEYVAEHNGKTFYWCSLATGAKPGTGCNMWTVHRPEDCKGLMGKKQGSGKPKKKSTKSKTDKALAAKTALMSIDSSSDDGYASE